MSKGDYFIPVKVNTFRFATYEVNEGLTQAIKTSEWVTKMEEKKRVLEVQTSEASFPVDEELWHNDKFPISPTIRLDL